MSELTTKILIEIRDELKGVRDEVQGVRDEVQGVRDEVQGVRDEVQGVRDELKAVNARLDSHERILQNQEEALVQIIDYEARHEKAVAKLIVGQDGLNKRLDNFLTGAHGQEHEETRRRFDEIETRLVRLEEKKRRRA